MPLNSTLKARATASAREVRYVNRIKSMCQPKEREGLYDVVSKFDGSIIQRAIPMDEFLKYGTAMVGYTLKPVN